MIVYISDSKNPMRKLLQLINTFSNVAGYKRNLKTKDKGTEKEIREKSPFTIVTNNKISWGNTNQRSKIPLQ